MNRIYRLVWDRRHAMFVPVAEVARAQKNQRGTQNKTRISRGPMKLDASFTPRAAILSAITFGMAGAAHAAPFLDFSNGLTGWTTAGTVSPSATTVSFSIGGSPFSLTPSDGYQMVRIAAGGGPTGVNSALGLSANSLENFLNNSTDGITNFGYITNTLSFTAGTYSFAWAYAAEDYQPFNDGAVFTLAGGGSQQLISLARNGSSPSDISGPSPNTLILGSYGSTAWLTTSFTVAADGDYQVGFAAYNWSDMSLSPNLFVSAVGGTFTGTPVTPVGGGAPQIIGGSGGNVSDSVFDTSSPAYAEPSLTFDGGTLQYSGATVTAKDFVLESGGGAVNTNGNQVTVSGAISGAGSFTKSGEGTLILDHDNTLTGGVNVTQGTLALTGNGSVATASAVAVNGTLDISGTNTGASVQTLSGTGTVQLGTQSLVLSNASGGFAGGFTGDGAVTLAGGTIELSGTSTHTGGMHLMNGATAIVTTDAALGSASSELHLQGGTLATAAALTLNRNVNVTHQSTIDAAVDATVVGAGSFSGSGAIVKTGAGTLVLAGDNSNWGSDAATTGLIVNQGTVVVGHSQALGRGAVALNSGALETGSDIVLSAPIHLGAGDTSIVTTGNSRAVIAGDISTAATGHGCFEKRGTGALVMTGAATIAAGTCVQAGSLYSNGQLNSQVTVAAAGTLRGTGTITGPVTVQGTLAPGNSPGVLQATATIEMLSGSVYQEDINGLGTGFGPGNYSRLVISGAGNQFIAGGATLVPNLVNITGSDTYIPYVPAVGDAFRIITAEGGISGEFATVVQPEGLAAATRMDVFYNVANSNSIDLLVVPTSYDAYVSAHGGNRNAQSVGSALDTLAQQRSAGAATAAQAELLYRLVTEQGATLNAAATQLSGEVHASMLTVAPLANRWLVDTVSRQLTHTVAEETRSAWVDLGMDSGKWRGDANASGFDTDRSQLVVGWNLLQGAAAQLGVGFMHADADVSAQGASGTLKQNQVFAYAQYGARAQFDLLAAYGTSDVETDRRDALSPFSKLTTDVEGRATLVAATVRVPMQLAGARLVPYGRVSWERISRDAFSEGAASLTSLTAGEHSASGLRVMAGVISGSSERDPLAAQFTYQLNLGVGHDDGELTSPRMRAMLAGAPTEIRSADVGQSFVQGQLSGTMRLTKRMFGQLGVSGELRSGKSSELGANLGLQVIF